MKEYKFCRYCKTENDINAQVCSACQAPLDDRIYKNNTLISIILAIITTLLIYILSKVIFISYGQEMIFFEICMLIILFLILLYYYKKLLGVKENSYVVKYLSFIHSGRNIYTFFHRGDLYKFTANNEANKYSNTKIINFAQKKAIFTLIYSPFFFLWLIGWQYINILKFDNIHNLLLGLCILFIILNGFLIPFCLLLIPYRPK